MKKVMIIQAIQMFEVVFLSSKEIGGGNNLVLIQRGLKTGFLDNASLRGKWFLGQKSANDNFYRKCIILKGFIYLFT